MDDQHSDSSRQEEKQTEEEEEARVASTRGAWSSAGASDAAAARPAAAAAAPLASLSGGCAVSGAALHAAAAAAAQEDITSLQVRPVQSGRSAQSPSRLKTLPQPQSQPSAPSSFATLTGTWRLFSSALLPPPPPPQPPAIPAPHTQTHAHADALADELASVRLSHASAPAHPQSEGAAAASADQGANHAHSFSPSSSSHAPLFHDSGDADFARRSSSSSSGSRDPLARTRPSAPLITIDTCDSCDAQNACALCKAAAEATAASASDSGKAAMPSFSYGSASPSLSADSDSSRFEVPPVSLEALEAEVQALYHIDVNEEAEALQRNREALRRMSLEEDSVTDEATGIVTVPTPKAATPSAAAGVTVPAAPLSARRPSVAQSGGWPVYSWSEIRQHACAESCWLVVRGVVYDVTPMLSTHPAGIQSILRNAGTEASQHFDFHSAAAARLWNKYKIGVLEGYQKPSMCAVQ